jgi:hypothetical protein
MMLREIENKPWYARAYYQNGEDYPLQEPGIHLAGLPVQVQAEIALPLIDGVRTTVTGSPNASPLSTPVTVMTPSVAPTERSSTYWVAAKLSPQLSRLEGPED